MEEFIYILVYTALVFFAGAFIGNFISKTLKIKWYEKVFICLI